MSSTNTANWQWYTLPTPSPMIAVTGADFGKQIFLGSNGATYHYNVYAAYGNVSISGASDMTPPPYLQMTHTAQAQFKYPQSMSRSWCNGCNVTQVGYYGPQDNIANFFGYDVADPIACDPFFGDPHQPNCFGTQINVVNCPSGGQLLSGGSPAPTPAPNQGHWSESVESFDATQAITDDLVVADPTMSKWAIVRIRCATYPTCFPSSAAVCTYPRIPNYVIQPAEAHVNGSGGADVVGIARSAARQKCFEHSRVYFYSNWGPGAWGRFSTFSYVNGVITCKLLVSFDATPYVSACY